jgi:hypothetical protein
VGHAFLIFLSFLGADAAKFAKKALESSENTNSTTKPAKKIPKWKMESNQLRNALGKASPMKKSSAAPKEDKDKSANKEAMALTLKMPPEGRY